MKENTSKLENVRHDRPRIEGAIVSTVISGVYIYLEPFIERLEVISFEIVLKVFASRFFFPFETCNVQSATLEGRRKKQLTQGCEQT